MKKIIHHLSKLATNQAAEVISKSYQMRSTLLLVESSSFFIMILFIIEVQKQTARLLR